MRLRTLVPVTLIVFAVGSCSDSTAAPIPTTTTTATSTTLVEARVEPAPPQTTTTWAPSAAPCTAPESWGVCEVADFPDRPYDIYIPSSYTESDPVPVVVALHGGGGKAESAITNTCAEGDRASPSCLHNIAEREGFVVVYPSGSGFGLLPNLKTWNAGGGIGGYNCVSGQACERGVDDIEYIGALLDDLESWLHVDRGMVYATGLSNGAALAHRLGCEMSERFAAIAAVGGTNQFAATEHCDLILSVSVMQIHGTEDPCWTYETSAEACADNSGGIKLGVAESTAGWVTRLSCEGAGTATDLPDVEDDGTTTTRTVWKGCADGSAEVHLMTINGGGHTWPGGDPYLAERMVGRVTYDWDSALVWDFFSQFHRD